MNLLLLTDTHGGHGAVLSVRDLAAKGAIDAVLHAGDYTSFGQYGEPLFEEVARARLPMFFVSGNHETHGQSTGLAKEYGGTCLDYASAMFQDVRLTGIPGSDLFTGKRPANMAKFLEKEPDRAGGAFSILLSHTAPAPWPWEGRTAGCPFVAEYIEDHPFDWVVVGHFHRSDPHEETWKPGVRILHPGGKGVILSWLQGKEAQWRSL
jgi:predicted phosphodiesterase